MQHKKRTLILKNKKKTTKKETLYSHGRGLLIFNIINKQKTNLDIIILK